MFAVVTNRKESWQGLEQDITCKVSPGSTYLVYARVAASGPIQGLVDVLATLKLEYHDSSATNYLFIGKSAVSNDCWQNLEGTFSLLTIPTRVVFYLEGASPGIDILIESVVIIPSSPRRHIRTAIGRLSNGDGEKNIILNPKFEDGLNNWAGRGCKVVLHESMADGRIIPQVGNVFASATERTQSWNGLQQDITGRVQRKIAFEVAAVVRIFGHNIVNADVRATLWTQSSDLREHFISIKSMQVTDKDWVQLQGKFLLNGSPKLVVIYIEGPPAGVDILIDSLVVKHAKKAAPSYPPMIENPSFGVNIVHNSNLNDGIDGWFPLGNCTLRIASGSPLIHTPVVRDTLGPREPLSGHYILATTRTQNWMGPAQVITKKLKLFLTYQVSAWVKIGSMANGPQKLNIALSVDGQWVNGGQTEIDDKRWHEIAGSFRIEKQPSHVMVYVQGPAPGLDFMVAALQIFSVDRQIRKSDILLKFSQINSIGLPGSFIMVRQIKNSFPIGSCISRSNMDNEDYVDFFVKNFNWAVFGNELKWDWTEPQQGKFNCRDADEMLDFCKSKGIEVRGHCIFWEVENMVQPWIRELENNDLLAVVQNRLVGLLSRYKEMFSHYDVNNEMLHGSFFKDRLGETIRAMMFKMASELDPSASLFVNDYHVEDGCDGQSSPDKYVSQILGLQEQGALVGGIGIQGHVDTPIGAVVCSALDKLGTLGIPIWFTELDVCSSNEFVRADDLEVMLREAFAHPAVHGIMLWGFWELFMGRDNAHLVDAEGNPNETGKRFLALRNEWLTHAHGQIDEKGEFRFRGFHGLYNVEVITWSGVLKKSFVVASGDSPFVVAVEM